MNEALRVLWEASFGLREDADPSQSYRPLPSPRPRPQPGAENETVSGSATLLPHTSPSQTLSDSATIEPGAGSRQTLSDAATIEPLPAHSQTMSDSATIEPLTAPSQTMSDSATIDPSAKTEIEGPPGAAAAKTSERLTEAARAAAKEDGFELIGELGRGGMGVIYRARQPSLEREVAIKTVNSKASENPELCQKFRDEALVTGYLDHPNVVPVYELGTLSDGRDLMAMKLVGGKEWKEILQESRGKARHLESQLGILLSVCNAVAFAHDRGFLHLDLKPQNVMVGDFGEVLVMDWGLAVDYRDALEGERRCMSRSEFLSPAGTPAYMAPELAEARGPELGPWTDVYLLGAILCEIISGRPPHQGPHIWAVLTAASASVPPKFDASVPAELAALCHRALAPSPGDRFDSVLGFRAAVEGYLEHRESLAISTAASQELALCAQQDGQAELLYSRYAETVAGFRQAQTLWAENPAGQAGERQARQSYAALALKNGDLGLAEAQTGALERLGVDCKELQQQLSSFRDRQLRKLRNGRLLRGGLAASVAVTLGVLGVSSVVVRNQRDAARRDRDSARIAEQKEATERLAADAAREAAEQARKAAEEARKNAEGERQKARYRLADSLVAQGDALATARQDRRAAEQYRQGKQTLRKLGRPTLTADAPRWVLFHRSPPPLHAFKLGRLVTSLALEPKARWALVSWGSKLLRCDFETGAPTDLGEHDAMVLAIALSPDQKLCASGDASGVIALRELPSGKLIRRLEGHKGGVTELAFHPDGRRLLSTSKDKTLRLWRLDSGKEVRCFRGHLGSVEGLSLSRDGSLAATASIDRTLRLWDLESGEERARVTCQDSYFTAIALSADGKLAVAGGQVDEGRIYEFSSGKLLRRLEGHQGGIMGLRLSADGRDVLSSSGDGTLRSWDFASGAERQSFDADSSSVAGLDITPDGRYALSGGSTGELKLWKLNDKLAEPSLKLPARAVMGIAFSQDKRLIATASTDRYARSGRYDLANATRRGPVDWTAEQRLLETQKVVNRRPGLVLWDAATGQQLHSFDSQPHQLMSVCFSPDGKTLLSGGLRAQLWDVATGRLIRTLSPKNELVFVTAFSPDGKRLLTGGRHIRTWDRDSGELLSSVDGMKFDRRTLAFHPDGKSFVGASKAGVEIVDLASGKRIQRLPGGTRYTSIAISGDGRRVLGATVHKELLLWDLASAKLLRKLPGSRAAIFCVALSRDGRYALTAGRSKSVNLFDLELNRRLCSYQDPGGNTSAIAFTETGLRALLGSYAERAQVLNLDFPKELDAWQDKLLHAQKRLQAAPNDAAALAQLGRWYSFRGEWNWAAEKLLAARAAGAKIPELEFARCRWRAGQLKAARDSFAAAAKERPEDAPYIKLCLRGFAVTLRHKAIQLMERARYDAASEAISAAIKIAPDWGELWYLRGSARASQQKPKQARNNFNRAVKLGYETAQLFFIRGRCASAQRDFPAAMKDFNEAIRRNPFRAEPYLGRGMVYSALRQEDRAMADFSKAIDLGKLPKAYSQRGIGHAVAGRPKRAMRDFDQAIAIAPRNVEARRSRGYTLLREGQPAKALIDLSIAAELQPRSPFIQRQRGSALSALKRPGEALRCYQRAIALDRRNPAGYRGLAEALEALGRNRESLRAYRQAILANPIARDRGALDTAIRRIEARLAGRTLGATPLSESPSAQQLQDREQYATALLLAGKVEKSVEVFADLIFHQKKGQTVQPNLFYNAACSYGRRAEIGPPERRAKDRAEALRLLEYLGAKGYDLRKTMIADRDLRSLHDEARWKAMIGGS